MIVVSGSCASSESEGSADLEGEGFAGLVGEGNVILMEGCVSFAAEAVVLGQFAAGHGM